MRWSLEVGCGAVEGQKGTLVRSGIRTHASRGDCDLNAAP